jgi:hypothetical protein
MYWLSVLLFQRPAVRGGPVVAPRGGVPQARGSPSGREESGNGLVDGLYSPTPTAGARDGRRGVSRRPRRTNLSLLVAVSADTLGNLEMPPSS